MKVTNEMEAAGARPIADNRGRPNVTVGDRGLARRVLEAALADVPEPQPRGPRLTAIYLDEARCFDAEDRARRAEAKLEAVRGVLCMTRRLTADVSAMCEQLALALAGDVR